MSNINAKKRVVEHEDDVIMKNVKFVIGVQNFIRKKGASFKLINGEIMKHPNLEFRLKLIVNVGLTCRFWYEVLFNTLTYLHGLDGALSFRNAGIVRFQVILERIVRERRDLIKMSVNAEQRKSAELVQE